MTWDLAKTPVTYAEVSEFVLTVLHSDDVEEEHWLELKGERADKLTSAIVSKVAKFVLGASNRSVDLAATRLGGSAAFILGVDEGRPKKIIGAPAFEVHELHEKLTPLLGPQGPRWSMTRVGIEGVTVVVVLVSGPKQGDLMYVCRKTTDAVTDGHIYIRPTSNTRQAKSAEIDAVLARSVPLDPSLELAVSVKPVYRYGVDAQKLDALVGRVADDLTDEIEEFSGLMRVLDRDDGYAQIRAFEHDAKKLHDQLMEGWMASFPATKISINNPGHGFFTDLQLELKLPESVHCEWKADEFDPNGVWPPRPQLVNPLMGAISMPQPYDWRIPTVAGQPGIDWDPERPDTLRINVPKVRPQSPTVLTEIVLMATSDGVAGLLEWTATASELSHPIRGQAILVEQRIPDASGLLVSRL